MAHNSFTFAYVTAVLAFFTSASLSAQPFDPYDDNYYDRYYDRYDGEPRGRYGSGEREIRDERKRLQRERERLDEIQRDLDEQRARPAPPPPPAARVPSEQCPSGFKPSEKKCSREERKRGCKDMRMPGGLGCVAR